MKKILLPLALIVLYACTASTQERKREDDKKETRSENIEKANPKNLNESFSLINKLPKKLKEVSGIAKDGNYLWAISDDPKADIYKLDMEGNIVQELFLNDHKVLDVEDVTMDADYLYIADVGDNNGSRGERKIFKIKKSSIKSDEKIKVNADVIEFSFPDQGDIKKKKNEYDCEAIISYADALYLFTKRRNDGKTELLKLPKAPGKQSPISVSIFDSKGLITGASINESRSEVALVGYQNGHKQPFVWLLSGFNGSNFFSGKKQQFILTKEKKDWQVEGVSFKDNGSLFFSCEGTKDVPASLYSLPKSVFE